MEFNFSNMPTLKTLEDFKEFMETTEGKAERKQYGRQHWEWSFQHMSKEFNTFLKENDKAIQTFNKRESTDVT